MEDKLTVLIPTRNRADDLRQALTRAGDSGLQRLRYLIYDDASDNADKTVKAAQALTHAKVIRGANRLGQAGGRNILLRACETPYALFMDDDTWFTKADALHQIVERDLLYEGIGKAVAVCAQVFRTSDGATLFPGELGTCQIINPIGMGCLIRTQGILQVGAFREYWRYRHEETELGLRLWKHNLPVVYDSSLLVEHCHTAAGRSSPEYDRNSARNLVLMHALNLPGFAGVPLGIMRSLRLLLVKEYSKSSLLAGLCEGIVDTYKHRHDVHPMPQAQYKELIRFRHELDKLFKHAGAK